MDKDMLADRMAALKAQFLVDVCPHARDQYEAKAFSSIAKHLEQMEHECRTGNLTPQEKRYGYIARMVTESDPNLLPPDLGGQLIDVEKAYRNL